MNIRFAFIGCFAFLFLFYSCTKDGGSSGAAGLTLQTTAVSSIKQLSAVAGGTISADGGSAILQWGVCWNTAANPTTANNKTAAGAGTGSFTVSINGLTPNTAYYVRAYAINSKDTAYGAQVSFTTQPISVPGGGVTDVEGNSYTTVIIGDKEWMVENLRVTKYQNGDAIPNIADNNGWANATAGAWCYYTNTAGYNLTLGKLYNQQAATDPRNIAPAGWHVPSTGEYNVLARNFGNDLVSGGALKKGGTSDWRAPNAGATNLSGFTALPGGERTGNGFFDRQGDYGYWWTTNTQGTISLYYNNDNYETLGYHDRNYGQSIRCVKN